MLTRQLGAQLRGLIVGLFMPVFFTLVGLTIDVSALAKPQFLWLTLLLIALASVGKFLGAFIGGRFGGLTPAESFAVGCGMNARGSTEVIVASIGLQLGALDLHWFTAIVAMAVVTTMAMPPMLRWAFARLPMSEEERTRLEREEFEARAFLPRIERLLVAVDDSASGSLASHLAGLLAAARRTPTTELHLEAMRTDTEGQARHAERSGALVEAAAAAGAEASAASRVPSPSATSNPIDVTTRTGTLAGAQSAVAAEAIKGYGLLLIGCEPAVVGNGFAPQITQTVQGFPGPFAIAIARGQQRTSAAAPLRVLARRGDRLVCRRSARRLGVAASVRRSTGPTRLRRRRRPRSHRDGRALRHRCSRRDPPVGQCTQCGVARALARAVQPAGDGSQSPARRSAVSRRDSGRDAGKGGHVAPVRLSGTRSGSRGGEACRSLRRVEIR